jgi:putative membrane protein
MVDNFAEKIILKEEIARITAAVREAESKTSGEIIPMIVSRSAAVGHVPYQCFLLILSSSLLLLLGWPSWWAWPHTWQAGALIGLTLVSFAAGFVLARIQFVQRWLVPDADEEAQVWRRAQAEWAQHKMEVTKSRSGILLFVSVLERRAVILADEGIAKRYDPATWQEVVSLLTGHLRRGEWAIGFERAIERCGEILATHLPSSADNPNEYRDELIIRP